MKNKNKYVGNIINATVISIFFFIIIIKNQEIISRLIILPFLFCNIFAIGKNMSNLSELQYNGFILKISKNIIRAYKLYF